MMLFESIVNYLLTENCTNYGQKLTFADNDPSKGFYVYHTTKVDKTDGVPMYQNIARVGFRRQHSGQGAGEMYGKGCYTTYTFLSSKYNVTGNGWYGNIIIKGICHINLKKMLIFDPNVSEQVYGKPLDIIEQLKLIFKDNPKLLDELNGSAGSRNFNEANRYFVSSQAVGDRIYTSVGAQMIWPLVRSFQNTFKKQIVGKYIAGVIYSGGNDGNCCVPWNFSCIEPIAYTTDLGQTWVDIDRNDWIHAELANNYDLKDELGNDYEYYRTEGFKDKYCIVGNRQGYDMKFRILNQQLFEISRKKGYNNDGRISDLYFDEVYGSSFNMNRILRVKYGDSDYILKALKYDNYEVFDEHQHYLCNLKDFEKYIDNLGKPQALNNRIQTQRVRATDDELDDI